MHLIAVRASSALLHIIYTRCNPIRPISEDLLAWPAWVYRRAFKAHDCREMVRHGNILFGLQRDADPSSVFNHQKLDIAPIRMLIKAEFLGQHEGCTGTAYIRNLRFETLQLH